ISASKGAGVRRRLEDLRPGFRALFGKLDGLAHLALDLLLEGGETVAIAAFLELFARAQKRVLLFAFFELGRRAVLARIAHRVAAEAIGPAFDERGSRLLAGAGDGLGDALLDLEHVGHDEAVARHAVAEGFEAH